MPQIFGQRANGVAGMVLWGVAAVALLILVLSVLLPRSGFFTGQGHIVTQPVPFSHEHHAGGLGIDCRYCHQGVETDAFAGLPPTETCMTCHSELWTGAEALEPVRRSLADGRPIHWQRVHDLADFVYFNHAAHVNNGVACETCHGDVATMPLIRQEAPLTMEWCLECHRDPGAQLRPRNGIYAMHWRPPRDMPSQDALLAQYDIHPERMTDCYVCHR
jgi:hypothetical protein